jgi:hypothetical protein
MPDRRPASAHITDWLLIELAKGPQPVGQLRERAVTLGYSWRGLQRAADGLGVSRAKAGMATGWQWSLTQAPLEGAISNGTFGTAVVGVPCLAAYGYEVPEDGLMHGVPQHE